MADTEGLTADGRYVSLGGIDETLTDQIVCGMDQNGDIIECAEIQPIEFIEKNWIDSFDFDSYLFANYGKDWWLGVLYKPARYGLLGSVAQRNATEAGDTIYAAYKMLMANKRGAYLLIRKMFNIALGLNESEAEIESCLADQPERLARFQQLTDDIQEKTAGLRNNAARRFAGGVGVGFALRRIRIPRKYLTGRPAKVRAPALITEFTAKMTINFALAGWGAMFRTYIEKTAPRRIRTQYATSWSPGTPPSPLELIGAMLVGDSSMLALSPDEVRDFSDAISSCDGVPEDLTEELEAFSYLLDVFITFYEERK